MFVLFQVPFAVRELLKQLISKSLSTDVFEQRTSTGSEVFFILKYLDATKFVLLSLFTVVETTCWKIWAKPPPMNGKSLLPVVLRRSNPFCLSSLKHVP